MKKIMMAVTSESKLGSTGAATGLYLSEFVHPYEVFDRLGFDVQVVSPLGGVAPIDPRSATEVDATACQHTLQTTTPLRDVVLEGIAAIFVVGGHGVMWDLAANESFHALLSRAFGRGIAIGAVCHGPAVLSKVKLENGTWLVEGKDVTGFSNAEEELAGLTKIVPFLVEDELRKNGGR
jgi:putative intracellular protease/amidase